MLLDRRLWLTADRSELVEDGDSRAAFLFGSVGAEVSDVDAERFGLKKKAAPADKSRKAADNK